MSNCYPNYEAVLGCPNCYKIYAIKDLDCFLDHKHMLWRHVLALLEDSFTKQQLIGSLAVSMAKKSIIREMEENGMLHATCLSCMNYFLRRNQFQLMNSNLNE